MERLMRLLRAWRSAKHPLRFAISRLLFHSGISPMFKMTRGGIVYRFWPSSMSMTLWADPGYAADDRHIVRTIVRPGDTVVDVGANIGFVALEAAAATAPAGRVTAYEPHPRIFRFLSGNAALNGWSHLALRDAAVGERAGTARITDGVADDQNRLSSDDAGVEVPVVTLDQDLPPGPIRLLKIDVEGFEVSVLQGGQGALLRTSWIYVEVAQAHQARFGHEAAELLTMLAASGFELWTRGGTGHFSRLRPGSVTDGCINVLGFRRTSGVVPLPGATAPLEELVHAGA
jgi:FkbM family methyltransferase